MSRSTPRGVGRGLVVLTRALLITLLVACGRASDTGTSSDSANPADPRAQLTGAGASFPYPLYARWFNEYAPIADRRINYLSIGSSEGIEAVIEHPGGLGATAAPMTRSLNNI